MVEAPSISSAQLNLIGDGAPHAFCTRHPSPPILRIDIHFVPVRSFPQRKTRVEMGWRDKLPRPPNLSPDWTYRSRSHA